MRLKIKISSAGDRWMARFPFAEKSVEDMAGPDGKVSEADVRDFLAAGSPEFITFASDDDKGVLFAAYEFLWQFSQCVRHLEADAKSDCTTTAETKQDKSLDRKMKRDSVSFCRMDFDRLASRGGAIRVRVSCANPKDVIGNALKSARSFAVDAVRIMQHIAREVGRNTDGKACILVEERADEASRGLVEEAARKDAMQDAAARREELEAKRVACPHRVNSFCTPCHPDCPCYCNGRCVEVGEVAR